MTDREPKDQSGAANRPQARRLAVDERARLSLAPPPGRPPRHRMQRSRIAMTLAGNSGNRENEATRPARRHTTDAACPRSLASRSRSAISAAMKSSVTLTPASALCFLLTRLANHAFQFLQIVFRQILAVDGSRNAAAAALAEPSKKVATSLSMADFVAFSRVTTGR